MGWGAAIAAGAAVTAILCWLVPDYFYHLDEIQLRLAVERVNLTWHHPHPPGYFVYVLLSRIVGTVSPLSIEPGRLVSALFAGLFVILLGARLDRNLAPFPRLLLLSASAGFVLVCPLVQFFSVAHLAYMTEAVLWVSILLTLAARPGRRGLWGLALLVGVSGGVRPTLLVWGVAALILVRALDRTWFPLREVGPMAVAMVAGVALWLVPMVIETGGLGAYSEATRCLMLGNVWSKSVFERGPGALLVRMVPMLRDALRAAGWTLLVGLAWWLVRGERTRGRNHPGEAAVLGIGALLPFLFYGCIIYDSAGYALAFVLPLVTLGLLTAGRVAARPGHGGAALGASLGAVMVLWGWLAGPSALSRAEIHRHDANLHARFAALRESFPPASTILVTSREYWNYGFRHLMYYLPEYTTLQLVRDRFYVRATHDAPYLTALHRRVWTSGPEGLNLASLGPFQHGGQVKRVVYTVPFDQGDFLDRSCRLHRRILTASNGDALAVLPVTAQVSVHVLGGKLYCLRETRRGGPLPPDLVPTGDSTGP